MEINKKSKMHFLDLYCMIMADGIVHPKELETLYRIGIETYGLTREEITSSVVSTGKTMVIPELPEERIGILYEMALIAWADGEIEDTERSLLRRYTLLYGVEDAKADDLVNYLLAKAKENVKEEDLINELKTGNYD